MTIIEAINRIDSLKPNSYSPEDKIAWLSIVDGEVKENIINTHEGSDKVTFNGYTENTPLDTVLLVPAPYDDIYIKWLEAQIDYANGETKRFNNSILMYNTAYSAFSRHYNRNHMPIGTNIKFF